MKAYLRYPILAALALSSLSLEAQNLVYSNVGADLVQDFVREAGISGGTTDAWPNATYYPGWSAYFEGLGAGPDQIWYNSAPQDNVWYFMGWRYNTSDTDFSLGAYPTDTSGDVHYGFTMTNSTGLTLTEFTLSYTGEQWRAGTTDMNQQIVVSYQIGNPANLADGTWTAIPGLTFDSILDYTTDANPAAATKMDGRLPENHIVLDPVLVSGITWEDGQSLTIRFTDINDLEATREHALAVDDITFSATVPEPATTALLLGLVTLGFVLYRRRRS